MSKKPDKGDGASSFECRVRVTKTSKALFDSLEGLGKYYRPRRIRELAELGLSVLEGRVIQSYQNPNLQTITQQTSVSPVASPSVPARVSQQEMPQNSHNDELTYTIPSNAADSVSELFAEIDA